MISDHLLTRCALQSLLEREKTIQVIGSGSLDQAQRVCRRHEPNLLLFEFHRVDLDPAQVLSRIAKACPSVNLLVLADAAVDARAILLNGAVGLVYLQESPQTLVQAIQVVARGGVWLDQAVVKQLVQEAKKVAPPPLKIRTYRTRRRGAAFDGGRKKRQTNRAHAPHGRAHRARSAA